MDKTFITNVDDIWSKVESMQKKYAYTGPKKKDTTPGWHVDATGVGETMLDRTNEYFTLADQLYAKFYKQVTSRNVIPTLEQPAL